MVDFVEDKEELVQRIMNEAGKTRKEIEKAIEEKKSKFSGMLTDSGAAFMVAKELNLSLELEKNISETTKIGNLQEGMNGVDVKAVVKQVFSPKKFEKGDKKGVLCSLIIGDDSGEIRLTVWHNDVKKLNELGIEKGTQIYLKNCYVSTYNDKNQLNLGYNGEIELLKEKLENLPKIESKITKLNKLKSGETEVNVAGRVVRVFDKRDFEKEDRKGSLVSFELVDETKKLRVTAWNELSDIANKLNKGELIKIENAYTKDGLNGEVEVQLGWQARIIREPKTVELPALEKLIDEKIEFKKINQLVAGEEVVKVRGKIVELHQGKLHYVVDNDIRVVVNAELEDDSGRVRIVCFGRHGEKLIGLTKDKLKKELEKKHAEDLIEKFKEKVLGKEYIVEGTVKEDRNEEGIELIVRELIEARAEEKVAKELVN